MRVHYYRLQNGWSQEELAAISGVSVRTIQRVERGQPASLETRKALAAAFGVAFSETGEPEMPDIQKLTSSEIEERLALEHVRLLRAFYTHAMQYAVTLAILIAVNLYFTPRFFWAGIVGLAWGAGLASHALRTFDLVPFMGVEWEKAKVADFLARRRPSSR